MKLYSNLLRYLLLSLIALGHAELLAQPVVQTPWLKNLIERLSTDNKFDQMMAAREILLLVLTEANSDRLSDLASDLRKNTTNLKDIVTLKDSSLCPGPMNFCPVKAGAPPALKLESIVQNDMTLITILAIRDGLYGQDGQQVKKILLGAAHDPVKKAALLGGQNIGACAKENWFLKILCVVWHPVCLWDIGWNDYQNALFEFDSSGLYKNIRKLLNDTIEDTEQTWAAFRLIPILEHASFKFFHEAAQKLTKEQLRDYLLILAELLRNPTTPQISPQDQAYFLFESITGNSLRNLDDKRLGELLDELSAYVLWFAQEVKS